MSRHTEKRYLLLISIHGLIRGHDLELGRDADTGGQIKYVIDLARNLALFDDVDQVDLVTRHIVDPVVSDDYAQAIEPLSDKARIIRIDAGSGDYMPKEQLWDHLDSFMDNLVSWLNEQHRMPDLIHTHYADAGYVGVRLSNLLSVPLVHTGHSLGRDKRKRLLARGLSREEVEQTYNIARRIDAEEEILANADLVITSTHNEIEEQYGLYNYYDPQRMTVIPPGTDLEQFHPPLQNERFAFKQQLEHFLKEPEKPLILALSRPDERKNILTLIEAYGESKALQDKANLLIVAGVRDDITDLDKGAQTVFTNILLLIDSYDLYGRVAIPKSHRADEVPEIYRLVMFNKGVFINPALTEPFGLTLLEAAASGLPVVATENGGPVDIIANCKCGKLVNPLDKNEIAQALLNYLSDHDTWNCTSRNGIKGVRKYYSWRAHTENYLGKVSQLQGKYEPLPESKPIKAIRYRDRAIFTDLDQNLIGNPPALDKFIAVIRENRKCVSFGIATGRRFDSALAIMTKHRIPRPDVLISDLGTRIHYGQNLTEDDFWADHIDHDWVPRRIKKLLSALPGLTRQIKSEQTPFKISYYYSVDKAPSLDEIITMIRQKEITANVSLSFGQFLDIIPARASKGQALRYVAQRLEIPLEHILVAGGSGADEDMMRGNTLAVVVENRHHEELSQLDDVDRIYFAGQSHASGIMEALAHYDFFDACRVPDA
ncbi:HAD-IIB family hydrolase [Candidatus Venteria ishoeyi]|uniref:sucrose-phosphate synthase n=1 Tax=Candidatus Venteria ishoeyi TaxID=1899563 RepID=A0A1H6FBE4_9GAMM|nr:HAD-IIB family hydrolase [Candidatus Venteria ishoeyi]MDM8548377.1 HAD-IIB family hydrolase [Candidatus Venteria ishoeyi]SEH06963.1 Mannosylfructose-phosphate synthase [Candidatus Venteria ishoeyi]